MAGPDIGELHDSIDRVVSRGCERVIVVTDASIVCDRDAVWGLLRRGADDVVEWRGPETATHVRNRLQRWADVDAILANDELRERLVGRIAVWRATLRRVAEIAGFTDANVLLVGESGTGKELIARTIHDLDRRARKGDF